MAKNCRTLFYRLCALYPLYKAGTGLVSSRPWSRQLTIGWAHASDETFLYALLLIDPKWVRRLWQRTGSRDGRSRPRAIKSRSTLLVAISVLRLHESHNSPSFLGDHWLEGKRMFENYIKESWGHLLRNSLDVALDPKVGPHMRTCLYIPSGEDAGAINLKINARRAQTENLAAIEVKILPDDLTITEEHGILYLPNDYVVPGGRFNEMYAWDSFWIITGLMQDGYSAIARGIVENFIYEIRHYGGKILNANRTYYLTRSQPPMLALMAFSVFPSLANTERTPFLQSLAEALSTEYENFWKTCRYDEANGLFHYGHSDQGAYGPCPESTFSERDEKGLSHYDKIALYLRDLPSDEPRRARFYDETNGGLTAEAFAGDRAMRESGFDASMHMGYYGLQTMDFDPVCLNTLLYVQCLLTEQIYKELGQNDRADFFRQEALGIAANIQRLMWDEATGLFCNYNRYEKRPSDFPYLTCVYPLWAGLATPAQAERFRENLSLFESEHGIRGTNRQTGCQWDAPFMWAPLVYFTVAGLHRYGFTEDAERIAKKFIDTVRRVYDATGANYEKYNADTGGIRTEGVIEVGYSENVVGFGWTNGAVSALAKWLQREKKTQNLHDEVGWIYFPDAWKATT